MDEMDEEVGTGGSPALRWGLTLGIVLSVLGILDQAVVTVLARQTHAEQLGQATLAPLSVALICLLPLLAFVLTFGMGILAGRETGAVGTAAIAGLFGVVTYTVVTTITGLVMNITASVWSILFATTPAFPTAGAGQMIFSTTCDLIVYGLIGMGVASLGGLIGRALAPDEEADQPPYPVYAGWDPAYGPPPYPPPGWNPAYGPPPYGPPGYGAPPPDSGTRPAEPPPPGPEVGRQ
jgi:hypothetical protein